MATYPSENSQQAENERLYFYGDALPEILAAGSSAPSTITRLTIQRLTAMSHVDRLETLPINAPRLGMDLAKRKLIPEKMVRDSAEKHDINNRTAATIVCECRSGDVKNLKTLAGLMKYQVRLDDPTFQQCVTDMGEDPLTEAEVAGFFHQAHVADAKHKLSLWQQSQSELDWLMFFQAMVNNNIEEDEVDMTTEEIQKYTDRKNPVR